MILSYRYLGAAGIGFCAFMMGVALILEHLMGLAPCPLCVFQRVAVIATAMVLVVAVVHSQAGRLAQSVYAVLALLTTAAGAGVAGRHLWLQSLPKDQLPSCGPELGYMLDILPLQDVVSRVLTGSGECGDVAFSLMGISLPGWTLIGFGLLALSPLWMLIRALR